MAAKQGGVNKLNIRYARPAAAVIPRISSPCPGLRSSKSSLTAKAVNTAPNVPTTSSLAINPVTAAAANCHIPKPSGTSKTAKGTDIS